MSVRKRIIGQALLALPAALAYGSAVQAQNQQPNQQPSQPPTNGHTLEAYVSEDAMQVLYMRQLDIDEVGSTELMGGLFFNEDRDLIAVAGALMSLGNPTERRRMTLDVGPRAYGVLLNTENDDIFGLGLGGVARYFFDSDRRTSVSLSAYYSPDILVFGNADNIKDVSLRFETGLRENTTIFLGYRILELDLELDREVDDNMHVGFRREF